MVLKYLRQWLSVKAYFNVYSLRRLLLVIYFLEVGVVLIVAPWSIFWESNYFLTLFPLAERLSRDTFIRGAVTGIGVANIFAGCIDFIKIKKNKKFSSSVFSPLQVDSVKRFDELS